MHEKETLVILSPGFPASEADTTCLPMQQQLIKTIKENFPALEIIVLGFQYPYFTKTYQWFGTTVMSFAGRNKGGLSRLLRRRKIIAVLNSLHRNKNIKGILSFWYGECAWIGKQFADKNQLKHYCWLLGQDARPGNRDVRRARLDGSELIALSDLIRDEFENNYGIKPQHIIPPGIEPKQFAAPVIIKDIDIIGAGSLIPLKQYEIFVEVVAEIKKYTPGIKAVLTGDGPEKNKLKLMINELGLGSNIILTGELSHPEVLKYMQRGKVFLHPSSYEGFGVVCIEALYAGCQVISFCKPMKQDIEHWSIVRNQQAMAQKAMDILQDPGSENTSVIPFTMKDTTKKMMELFGLS
ncbi:MAG TPA: glycosyltransferase [Ferruginibacter sp.]|nr:glycosyltransferase [Ferruginibacter sp.]